MMIMVVVFGAYCSFGNVQARIGPVRHSSAWFGIVRQKGAVLVVSLDFQWQARPQTSTRRYRRPARPWCHHTGSCGSTRPVASLRFLQPPGARLEAAERPDLSCPSRCLFPCRTTRGSRQGRTACRHRRFHIQESPALLACRGWAATCRQASGRLVLCFSTCPLQRMSHQAVYAFHCRQQERQVWQAPRQQILQVWYVRLSSSS